MHSWRFLSWDHFFAETRPFAPAPHEALLKTYQGLTVVLQPRPGSLLARSTAASCRCRIPKLLPDLSRLTVCTTGFVVVCKAQFRWVKRIQAAHQGPQCRSKGASFRSCRVSGRVSTGMPGLAVVQRLWCEQQLASATTGKGATVPVDFQHTQAARRSACVREACRSPFPCCTSPRPAFAIQDCRAFPARAEFPAGSPLSVCSCLPPIVCLAALDQLSLRLNQTLFKQHRHPEANPRIPSGNHPAFTSLR